MAYTPGPWEANEADPGEFFPWEVRKNGYYIAVCQDVVRQGETESNARLLAAAPDLLQALENVRLLISEAAQTGFNYKDGDWAEKLFLSQQKSSAAIRKAIGK